jgi:predicted pyridoxine 5'-phosphate oxidase superfamily flavin-nucleotide-binding protein
MSGGLDPDEKEYLGEPDTFSMASLGESGWPYVQHREGPKGIRKVIDDTTLAFADFRGNKKYISTGNLLSDNRVALLVVDDPQRVAMEASGTSRNLRGRTSEGPAPQSPRFGIQSCNGTSLCHPDGSV